MRRTRLRLVARDDLTINENEWPDSWQHECSRVDPSVCNGGRRIFSRDDCDCREWDDLEPGDPMIVGGFSVVRVEI